MPAAHTRRATSGPGRIAYHHKETTCPVFPVFCPVSPLCWPCPCPVAWIPARQQANEHLAKVQAILQNGLDVYQEELKKSPEEKREQELRQGLAVLQRQLVLEQAAARDVVSKHMLARIEAWRADKGDVAVIARQNVLSAPASMDITAEIISRMDAGSVQFAELPKVSIRTHADGPDEKAGKEEKTGKNDKGAKNEKK